MLTQSDTELTEHGNIESSGLGTKLSSSPMSPTIQWIITIVNGPLTSPLSLSLTILQPGNSHNSAWLWKHESAEAELGGDVYFVCRSFGGKILFVCRSFV